MVTDAALRATIVDVARDERLRWLDAAGTTLLQEGVVGQFDQLVKYWLATIGAMQPSTLVHAQGVATDGTIDYRPLLRAVGTVDISAAAAAIRARLLAGAPNAGTPATLGALVDDSLIKARESRTGPHRDREPWSSAFVSDCVRRVAINLGLETDARGTHQGRDVLLRYSGGHRVYLHEAHRRTSGPAQRDGTYHAFQPPARAVQVGDIIIQDRSRRATSVATVFQFANIPSILRGRALHGDIVTEVVSGDHAVAIGGNVGHSVRRRRYPLDANDRLVVAQAQLYTQEADNVTLPALPATSTAALHARSTARIFALLSPVPTCVIVPNPLFGGPAA